MDLSLDRTSLSKYQSLQEVGFQFTNTSWSNNGHRLVSVKHDFSVVSILTTLAIPIWRFFVLFQLNKNSGRYYLDRQAKFTTYYVAMTIIKCKVVTAPANLFIVSLSFISFSSLKSF